MDKYQKVKVLGKGSFGSAILIKRKSDGALFVVKEVSLLKMSKKERDEARHECTVLQQLHHPNIVRYIEQFENRNNLYIVMEYCDGGDLAGKVKEARGPMKESQMMYYFSQVCLAMEYLHSRHILHRDIKTMNVFLMKSGAVKLGDFGISTVLRNTMGMANTVCGTPYYFSPELCRNKPYNNKSDIWALGVLLYECATGGRHPFDGNSMNQLMQRIVKGSYPPLSSQYSSDFRKMVDWCLQKDPHKRPSIKQTLALPVVRRSLEQLEENLMLATQCRVRLKDIIDFESALDNQTSASNAKQTGQSQQPPAVSATPGLTPGQAAALAMAKEQQAQHPKPLSPRSHGAAAAVVGPKPSAITPLPRPQAQASPQNHYSPYHQQIMKNLEKLREQKRGGPGAVAGAGAPPSPAPSSAVSPSPSAAVSPTAPSQARAESPRAAPRPSSPATGAASPSTPAIPSPAGGENGRYPRSHVSAAPTPQTPSREKAAMQDDMRRVDAIMAKYGQNVDDKAKETIHAYMRRKQEEYLRRQREENERRERRNELRQKELKRVLDRQRGIVSGADSPAKATPSQQKAPRRVSALPASAARPTTPGKDAAAGEAVLRQRTPVKPGARPAPPAGPSPTSPRHGRNAGSASPSLSPSASPSRSHSRPQTPSAAGAAAPPAHLRQHNANRAAFGRDPRLKDVKTGEPEPRPRRSSPSSGVTGRGVVRNPLRRPSVGADVAKPSAREQLQHQQPQQRKKIVLAANSPRLLAGGAGAAHSGDKKEAAPRSRASESRPESPSRASPTPRTELVEARLAAAQELREKRERLQALAAAPSPRLSPRKTSGLAVDSDPTHPGHHSSDNSSANIPRRLQQLPVGGAASPTSGQPVSGSESPSTWAQPAGPVPLLGLEAVGHRASPALAVSPTRRKAGAGALSPVSALPTRMSDPTGAPVGAGGAAPLSPSSRSPRANLRSPARRHKVAAGSDKRRAGALPPVSAEVPELIDVQYGIAKRDGGSRVNSASSGASPRGVSANAADPLRMLRKKQSIGTATGTSSNPGRGQGLAEAAGRHHGGGGGDVPSVFIPVGGADVASSPYNPHRLHHQHHSVLGDADVYVGMRRGTGAPAEEAESFLGAHNRRGDPVDAASAMPSMLEALRSLREGDRGLEEDLAVHKSGQLALLKQRQQNQRYQQRPSLPSRLSGEVERFWDGPKPLPPLPSSPEVPPVTPSPSASPLSPQPLPRHALARNGGGVSGSVLPPPLATVETDLAEADAPPSPSGRRGSTDGYAEMLQHLKDLLQRRKAGNDRGPSGEGRAAPRRAADEQTLSSASHGSTGSQGLGSGSSPPALHHTKAKPGTGLGSGLTSTDAERTDDEGTEADAADGSDSLAVSSSGADVAEGDEEEEEDFEDAVPLSPVRHAELNDTYARMMANLQTDGADDDATPSLQEEVGVYTDDVFLNNGKAEVEEEGEEGYTGYYKLPSPTSLVSP